MARSRRNRTRRGFLYWLTSVGIAALASILPFCAIYKARETVDPKYITLYLLVISGFTVFTYWSDKKKAKSDSWRTPESTLHLLELVGGWFAAFFSQRFFRHKTAKRKYQIVFWTIAVIHQCVAFDYLNGWRWTQAFAEFF